MIRQVDFSEFKQMYQRGSTGSETAAFACFNKLPFSLLAAGFRRKLALAGFSKDDVEVEFEDNLLTVRTKQVNKSEDKNSDGEIIHKGISQRQFARSFTIADDVKVGEAKLKDGLLTISCERIIPEHKKKKLIEIK